MKEDGLDWGDAGSKEDRKNLGQSHFVYCSVTLAKMATDPGALSLGDPS